MKRALLFFPCLLLSAVAFAQGGNPALDKVLKAMDQQAAGFKTAQADFIWDQYTKVVDEHDTQSGTIYFRRSGNNQVQMAADIKQPAAKYVTFDGGLVRIYEPKISRVTEYNTGKNKAEFESFLVLGFGGSGKDLRNNFDIKYGASEQVQGVNAAKLTLTPKAQSVRNNFPTIILWIDPARGISVQQQFIDPDGNYRLAKYSNIKLNEKINDDVFKLKTSGKVTVVKPNS